MTPKIAIYGTGQYAMEAVRIIVDKGWDIIAAYNRAGTKVGQDLGTLADLPSPSVSSSKIVKPPITPPAVPISPFIA